MATTTEIIATLNSSEKSSYGELIDVGTNDYVSDKIKFNIISSFMQGRVNRLTAIKTLIESNEETNNVAGNYAIFRETVKKIYSKNEELDRWNGLLSQKIYGDVRRNRERKREIAELTKKNALIVAEVINRYDEFYTEMKNIKAKLT